MHGTTIKKYLEIIILVPEILEVQLYEFFIFTRLRIYDVVLWFMTPCDLVDVTVVSEEHIVPYVRT